VEPIRASAPLEVVPLAMPTKKEERRVDPQPRANFGTFESAAEDKPSGTRFMLLGVVAILLVAAAATFALLKMRKPGSTPAQPTQQAANVPAQSPGASANGQPATQVNASANPNNPPVVVAASPRASAKAASETGSAKKSAKNSDKTSSPEERESAAEKPTTVATLNGGGPSRIQQSASASTADVAPSFGVASSNTAALPTLTRAVPTSTPSAAIQQSQLEPLKLIKTVPLSYPTLARARHLSGTVVVEVKVGKDGKVTNPKFVSGPPIFRDAAFDAVTQYRFKPATLNGVPIEQTTQIRLDFRDHE